MAKTAQIVTTARLRQQYRQEIVKALQKELNLKNVNEVPKLDKIVLNIGLGRAKDDKKFWQRPLTPCVRLPVNSQSIQLPKRLSPALSCVKVIKSVSKLRSVAIGCTNLPIDSLIL